MEAFGGDLFFFFAVSSFGGIDVLGGGLGGGVSGESIGSHCPSSEMSEYSPNGRTLKGFVLVKLISGVSVMII